MPDAFDGHQRVFVVEGPTDTASLLDMGFDAIGRPNCSGGIKAIVGLLDRYRTPDVVVVADGDVPGLRGAENLASVLVAYVPSVRVIVPPVGVKDVREWRRRGAEGNDVQALVDAAPVRRLKITCRERKRR